MGSPERAISARVTGVVRAFGWICSMDQTFPVFSLGQALETRGILYNRQTNRIPTMFRNLTTSTTLAV